VPDGFLFVNDFLLDFVGLRLPLATGVEVDGCLFEVLTFKVLPFNGLLGGPVDFRATGNFPGVFLVGEEFPDCFLAEAGDFWAGVRELLLFLDACFSSNVEWVKKPELSLSSLLANSSWTFSLFLPLALPRLLAILTSHLTISCRSESSKY